MKYISLAATAMLLGIAFPSVADDLARTAVSQAFARQKALPGYVEHQFGQLPLMPTALDVDMESAGRSSEPSDAEPVVELSPEQEIATIEHFGDREHQLLANGMGEIVRGDGKLAYRVTLPSQVKASIASTTKENNDDVAKETQSTLRSVKALAAALARGGSIDVFGAAVTLLDQVAQLLSHARSTADLTKANAMLERISGTWQCRPDSAPQYPRKLQAAEPLEDRSIGSARAHVYAVSWRFDSTQSGFELDGRVWIGGSDGMPLRSELSFPGGASLRSEYEYPTVAQTIAMPDCAVSKP